MNSINALTEKEVLFCQLYVDGSAPFGGNADRCYREVFSEDGKVTRARAMKLLSKPEVQEYIEALQADTSYDVKQKRLYIARHLEHIIEEASTAEYFDRKGNLTCPAAMRSVAVQAMKLYSEIYPIKEAQVSKISVEGNEGGITFNVIVPSAQTTSTPPANE